MSDTLDITDVCTSTGITPRALRFYEARGLIAPGRTPSGRRFYSASDLARIHQIVALKATGLSLADIGRLLNGRVIDLGALLRAQLSTLNSRMGEIENARKMIVTTLSRIERGEPIDAATFCSLIKQGDITVSRKDMNKVVSEYWPIAAKMQFGMRIGDSVKQFTSSEYHAKWAELGTRIKAALPLDPASDQALAFVREWLVLLEPFSRIATREMWDSASNMYNNIDKWRSANADPGFDKQVWDFIQTASQIHRERGQDVGPLPAFKQ